MLPLASADFFFAIDFQQEMGGYRKSIALTYYTLSLPAHQVQKCIRYSWSKYPKEPVSQWTKKDIFYLIYSIVFSCGKEAFNNTVGLLVNQRQIYGLLVVGKSDNDRKAS